jgi:hypothetical protein
VTKTGRFRARASCGGSGADFTLLGANVVSSVGNNITTLAVPWFVLETTGSAARTGITERLGVIVTITAIGVIYQAVTLSMFIRPVLREMDAPASR